MSRARKLGLIGLVTVLAVGGLCWASISSSSSSHSADIRRAEVTYSSAQQGGEISVEKCPIPIPDTASNLQYAVWSFGEVTQSWIRFEAPAADCLEHAERMLQPFRHVEDHTVTRTSIKEDPGVLCVLDPTEVDLSWFADCQSVPGPVFRVTGGRAPVIWVDTNEGIFYCEVKNKKHSLSPP